MFIRFCITDFGKCKIKLIGYFKSEIKFDKIKCYTIVWVIGDIIMFHNRSTRYSKAGCNYDKWQSCD